jgi:hypothetical protein
VAGAVTVDLLKDLATGVQAVRTGPETVAAGQAAAFRVLKPPELKLTDLVSRQIDVTWFAKNIRFPTPGVLPQPLKATLAPPKQVLDNVCRIPFVRQVLTALRPGVPGLLGQAGASFMVPTEVSVLVSLKARWKVFDQAGSQLSEGDAFVSTTGMNLSDVSVLLAPPVVEARAGMTLEPVERSVQAEIQLVAMGVESPWLPLPKITVKVLPLPVPKVAVFFLQPGYGKNGEPAYEPDSCTRDRATVVMVPPHSPFKNLAEVTNRLQEIRALLTPFNGIVRLAAGGSGALAAYNAITGATNVHFIVANEVSDLNAYTLIQRAWYENDTEAEDEISSMILIGPKGSKIDCFNGRSFGTGEGALRVETGDELYAGIPDLHSSSPGSQPANKMQRLSAPAGQRFESLGQPIRNITTFGNEFSSLRFA